MTMRLTFLVLLISLYIYVGILGDERISWCYPRIGCFLLLSEHYMTNDVSKAGEMCDARKPGGRLVGSALEQKNVYELSFLMDIARKWGHNLLLDAIPTMKTHNTVSFHWTIDKTIVEELEDIPKPNCNFSRSVVVLTENGIDLDMCPTKNYIVVCHFACEQVENLNGVHSQEECDKKCIRQPPCRNGTFYPPSTCKLSPPVPADECFLKLNGLNVRSEVKKDEIEDDASTTTTLLLFFFVVVIIGSVCYVLYVKKEEEVDDLSHDSVEEVYVVQDDKAATDESKKAHTFDAVETKAPEESNSVAPNKMKSNLANAKSKSKEALAVKFVSDKKNTKENITGDLEAIKNEITQAKSAEGAAKGKVESAKSIVAEPLKSNAEMSVKSDVVGSVKSDVVGSVKSNTARTGTKTVNSDAAGVTSEALRVVPSGKKQAAPSFKDIKAERTELKTVKESEKKKETNKKDPSADPKLTFTEDEASNTDQMSMDKTLVTEVKKLLLDKPFQKKKGDS